MKIRICLLIILMGLLYPGYISSQESPYVFRQIGVVEGLPDNYVKSVFPIPDGQAGRVRPHPHLPRPRRQQDW